MKKLIHTMYVFFGTIFCRICLIYWKLRDKISPPDTDSVLFVAHPDDDTLFFHTFIKEHNPYVVLLFTGWSRRLLDFFKVMRNYGVKYRAYPTVSAGAYTDRKRREVTKKYIGNCLKIMRFKTIAFHNSEGEYGHGTHKLVHEAVMEVCAENSEDYERLCPVPLSEIGNYPLSGKEKQEKKYIFENMYVTEKWVMAEEEAGTPIWFNNERLERIDGNIERHTTL